MVSVLPIKYCVELVDPLDEPLEEEPLDDPPDDVPPLNPEPEPSLTVPLGVCIVTPLVENTTLPLLSVRYVVIPAEDNLLNAVGVG